MPKRSVISRPSPRQAAVTPELAPGYKIPAWLPWVALVLLTLAVHFPGLNGVYIWDDPDWLTANPAIPHWNTFWDLWAPDKIPRYFPLVTSSFWIEHKIWGFGGKDAEGIQRPIGYHVDNLLLHLAAALILWRIVRRMKLPGGAAAAWVAAAIFAIHPVTVESVAWISERKNTLCGVLLFLSAWYSFKAFGIFPTGGASASSAADASRSAGGTARRRDYFLGVGLFLASMLAKSNACFLPPALLILVWWRRGGITRREIFKSLPYFVIALVMGGLSAFLEKHVTGATEPEFAFSFFQRLLIAGNAYWFYIGKLLWPYPVIEIYPRFPIEAGKPVEAAWLLMGPIVLAALIAVLVIFRRRLGRPGRATLAAMLLFGVALFPALGFISFYSMFFSFVADHYQYLACPIMIVFFVEAGFLGVRRISALVPAVGDGRRVIRLLAPALAGGILLAFGRYSFFVSNLYASNLTLWIYALQHNPGNYVVLNQSAVAAMTEPKPDYTIVMALLQKSLELHPDQWKAHELSYEAYSNLGQADKAAQSLQEMELHMPAEEWAGWKRRMLAQAVAATQR